MAKLLHCDRCGEQTPDTEEGKRNWIGLALHKVQTPTSVIKDYDLCHNCTEEIRRTLTRRSTIGWPPA